MRSRAGHYVVLCLAGALAAGCARTVLDSSVVDQHGGPDAELEFWSTLESKGAVTANDALHGLLLLADGADDRIELHDEL